MDTYQQIRIEVGSVEHVQTLINSCCHEGGSRPFTDIQVAWPSEWVLFRPYGTGPVDQDLGIDADPATQGPPVLIVVPQGYEITACARRHKRTNVASLYLKKGPPYDVYLRGPNPVRFAKQVPHRMIHEGPWLEAREYIYSNDPAREQLPDLGKGYRAQIRDSEDAFWVRITQAENPQYTATRRRYHGATISDLAHGQLYAREGSIVIFDGVSIFDTKLPAL